MKVPELLDLTGRIEEAAIGGDVVQALLLCQKLGGDAASAQLCEWAKHELEGYPEGAEQPEYRRVVGQLLGDGAAPNTRISRAPIPMDALPEAEQEALAAGIPLRASISEIQGMATREHITWRPSHTGAMLAAVNASNTSMVMYDDVYFQVSGPALDGVVTAVRSKMIALVTLLRASLPDDVKPDSASVNTMVSEVVTAPTVNIVGSNNEVSLGDGGDVNVGTVSDDGSSTERTSKVWRWLKRLIEAITAIATAVAVLWGSAGSPL